MTNYTRGQILGADQLNTDFSVRVLRSGDTMTGPLVLSRDPQSTFEAATKQYADSRVAGVPVLTSNAVGVLIPGYVYPNNPYSDPTMQGFIQLVRNNHDVPVLYVINPANGPGTVADGNYAALIRLLRASGVHVLAYVSTQYAARDPNAVKLDVLNWIALYGLVDGIFYDEMPYVLGTNNANIALYQQYYTHAKSQGYQIVVANPGTNQQGAWYSANPLTADIIVTWENSTYPIESDLQGNFVDGHGDYSYKRNSVLVYAQTFDPVAFAMMKKYAKYVWVTDDVLANQWDAFPTYMASIFAACRPATASGIQRLTSSIAPVSLPGAVTSEQDLQTFSLPAGTLANNGQALRIKAMGSFAIHGGATRSARLYFGGTSIAVASTGGTAGLTGWSLEAYVWRLSGTTQISQGLAPYGPSNANVTATESTQAAPGETLSNPITIKTTGQTSIAQAADVTSSVLMVELLP